MNKYGLTEEEQKELITLFEKYPEIDEVILFGSRAMNTFTKTSDIDFALKGNGVSKIIGALISDFEDSSIIYEVDVIDYHGISSEALLEHIRKYGKVFYRKGWVETTLGEVLKLNYGKSLTAKKRNHGNIPVYGSSGITGWHNQALIPHNGIIVGRKGTVGSIYRSSTPFYPIDTVYFITEENTKLDFDYLYYFLKYLKLEEMNSDSAVPGLNRDRVYSESIIIPTDKEEQKAIAAVLSAFDDKIELLREQNQTLETLAQTIFKEWFVHFNFPDKDGKPYHDNGGEMVDSELGEIPKGWRVDELGNVALIIAGGDKPKNVTSQKTVKNIIPIYSNGIKNEGLYGYTDTARIFDESVTVSARGTIGFVCLRMEPYLPIVRLLSVIPDKNILSGKYLFFWLKKFDINGFGTTQQQLTVPVFKKSEIIIATSTVINQFTQIVDSIYCKIKNNTAQIQTLSKTRDTLLPKLMNGTIRVKNA